jgi:hypothetical protein
MTNRTWTQPLCIFAATSIAMYEFGALTQALPRVIAALDTADSDNPSLRYLQSKQYHDWPMVQDYSEFQRICDEAILGRTVDAFDRYLVGVVELVLRREPRLLRSKATLQADELLTYTSIEEIIERLLTKKIDELSFAGFGAILDYVRGKLGASIEITDDALAKATTAIAVRNIIVHNGGRVNRRFTEQTKLKDLALGAVYPIDATSVQTWVTALRHVAQSIDCALVAHFRLDTIEIQADGGVAIRRAILSTLSPA